MDVTDKDDITMDITNEAGTDTPPQDVPGADLAAALLPANSWTQHLNDPASTLATTSPPALHKIIDHGTTEYEKMVKAWRAEKARADGLQAEKDEMIRQLQANQVKTIDAAPLAFRSKTHPLRHAQADSYMNYSLPKPTYSDRCIQQEQGKQCPRNRCKYVHKDQEELYGDHIAGLAHANKAAKVNDRERMDI